MITLFEKDATDFSDNGICVLSPSSCHVAEMAGGTYELEMEHPLDENKKYLMLTEERLIKAPIPRTIIPETVMPALIVCRTNQPDPDGTPLYSKIPQTRYSNSNWRILQNVAANQSSYTYQSGEYYNAGAIVLYDGTTVYRCKIGCYNTPPTWSIFWEYIGKLSEANPVVVAGVVIETLAYNTEVWKFAEVSGAYTKVRTKNSGKVGFVKTAHLTETEDRHQETIPEQTITHQVFRIYEVSCDEKTNLYTVRARHLSYDYKRNLLSECKVTNVSPNEAIAAIQGATIMEDQRTVACNIVEGDISQEWTAMNPINALLDPESGLVDKLGAAVVRNNQNFFILGRTELSTRQKAGIIQKFYFELGTVDLLKRPQVPASTLTAAGWTDVGEGTATVFSCTYYAGTDVPDGISWVRNIIIHITPIKADGTVLSPTQLNDYVDTLLQNNTTIGGVITADRSNKKLILWVQKGFTSWSAGETEAELYDDLLHRLQAVYYLNDTQSMPTDQELAAFNPDIRVPEPYGNKGFTIEYGVNLRGVNWTRNVENAVTRVIPRSGNSEKGYLYISDGGRISNGRVQNQSKNYVESDIADQYAVPILYDLNCSYQVGQEYEQPDGTKVKYDEATVLAKMKTDALEMFTKKHVDGVDISLDVDFILLGDTVEFQQYKGLQAVNLYDTVKIKTGKSQIETEAMVTEYDYDCILGRYKTIRLGTVNEFKRRVPGYRMINKSITYDKLAPDLINRILTSDRSSTSDNGDNGGTSTRGDGEHIVVPNTEVNAGIVAAGGDYPNMVWATNGAGKPAWRSLADIPNLS